MRFGRGGGFPITRLEIGLQTGLQGFTRPVDQRFRRLEGGTQHRCNFVVAQFTLAAKGQCGALLLGQVG